jgi:pyruvate kinase
MGSSAELYGAIARELVARGYVERGDRIILTMGELTGVAGGTNTMKILEVS